MSMYSKSGQFDNALDIFDKLKNPDIVSWNTVISGILNSKEAFSFALQMNINGVIFDAVTYTTLLAFCSSYEEFLFGLQLHSLIAKQGLDCEIYVGNALITMYSRLNRLGEATKLFDTMPTRDLVSWNSIISGYSQEGIYGFEAILCFLEMLKEGMKPDHVSLSSTVSACGHERNLRLGRQIHNLVIKTGYESHISTSNILISMYSKCEVKEDANLVFKCMKDRNVVSWTTMISMNEEDSLSLFNKMRLDEVYPNDVTFVGLIHNISFHNLIKEGAMIHCFCLKTSFSSESNVANSLITMYAKFNSMRDSRWVFDELNSREIISWNALISGYSQNGLYKEAIETFLLAIKESKPNEFTFGSILSGIAAAESISLRYGQNCHSHLLKVGLNNKPILSGALLDMYAKRGSISESRRVFEETFEKSQVTWTAMISAYARHGDYESVMGFFREMESEGVDLDSITFLSVLASCGRKGMVDMGHRIFDSMVKDHKIEPSQEHFSCVVDMLGRAGRVKEAEEFLGRIPGGPGLSTLQSLLGACRIYGEVEIGERVAEALMKMEPSESGSYVLMSNLYAERGEWQKAAKLRKGMRERRVKKEVGFSWADVGGVEGSLCLHGFSSDDMSHPQTEEIYRMAKWLGLEMIFREIEHSSI